ncbi:hypothetical protein [uncultured Psychroserpens sp.]|uniref:hypothetical protein n=1 Tax=uncultured Psychroserpens sp. TaxID=255436 RepID=UPI00260B46D8|nr:hypothetical protein [uncultured Psychroserpens sp.]
MKKNHKLLFAFCLLISFNSCEKEAVNDYEINSKNTQITDVYSRAKAQTQTSDSEALENNMQWVAYMTAQILIKDVNATNQFMSRYNSGMINNDYSIIRLSELLNNQQTNQSFRDAFENEFVIFNGEAHNPCENQGKPKLRPTPPPCNPTPCALPNEDIFEIYVDYLISEHCLEIYVSGGLDLLQNIMSSAHPLNTTNINAGFEHFNLNECLVNEVTIDGNGVGNLYSNLIVVRPYREIHECDYLQFPNIPDFSQFPY